jgi:hypothetical protein
MLRLPLYICRIDDQLIAKLTVMAGIKSNIYRIAAVPVKPFENVLLVSFPTARAI